MAVINHTGCKSVAILLYLNFQKDTSDDAPGTFGECDISDDYTIVNIFPGSPPVVLRSLNESYSDEYMIQEYHPVTGNGIDGKLEVFWTCNPPLDPPLDDFDGFC